MGVCLPICKDETYDIHNRVVIKPSRSIVVYAGTERQTLRESIEVMPLMDLIREIQTAAQ